MRARTDEIKQNLKEQKEKSCEGQKNNRSCGVKINDNFKIKLNYF